jgi:hypothetical protein
VEAFAGEVLAVLMNRPVQRVNGGLYLRDNQHPHPVARRSAQGTSILLQQAIRSDASRSRL